MYGFIMAGGIGSRFWPLSREVTPKQLLKIAGPETMIQQTVKRLEPYIASDNIYIVTNLKHRDEIARQLDMNNKKLMGNIIIEPSGRDTAAAVGLAAVHLSAINPDAVMGVFPSDHVIKNEKKFISLIRFAESVAKRGEIVTLGITADKPETGYGYIRKGKKAHIDSDADIDVFLVDRFIEKPDIARAREFLKTDDYLWNSGMFFWTASRVMSEIKRALPDLFDGLQLISSALKKGEKEYRKALDNIYPDLLKVSIDKGVMESADKVMVVPADIGWNDVGSWAALGDIIESDDNNNIIEGNIVNNCCSNSILIGCDRVVATIGLENIIVVDTPDATMICAKDSSQDVKKVVDILQERGAEECIEHLTVERVWGSYTVLGSSKRFKIKKICIKPGAKLSLQYHHHRSEHWVVVQGTAYVTKGEETFPLHENESSYIPMSTVHRLENRGIIDLHIIEVQNGSYLGEDDIVRISDDYGRI